MGICEFYNAQIASGQWLWDGKRGDGFPKKNMRSWHLCSGFGMVKGVMDFLRKTRTVDLDAAALRCKGVVNFPRKIRANCIDAAALGW